MKTIKVAIIGTGFIAEYHTRGLLGLADIEITVAVDTQIKSVKKFASKYNIKEIATDTNSIVDRDDIDAVIIGTPNKFHAPYALKFLRKEKDVFIEKPLAMSSEEGKEIIGASKSTNQLVMVGHMWRFDTEVNYMKKVVDSESFGKVFKTRGYGIHENWGPSGWFTQKNMAGGGALIDMGVHAIDTVRYILGDPDPLTVYAKIGTFFGDYDVDDSGIVIITWDNGTTSIIESGWWHLHLDGPEAATRLFGTNGYGSLFPTFLKLKGKNSKGSFKVPINFKSEHCDQSIYTRQMEYFIDCIRARKQPSPGLMEGQTVLNIVDAAYLSSLKKVVVRL